MEIRDISNYLNSVRRLLIHSKFFNNEELSQKMSYLEASVTYSSHESLINNKIKKDKMLTIIKTGFLILILAGTTWACTSKTRPEAELPREVQTRLDTAYFAGGCFWCTEAIFERVRGVVDVVSGYAGGNNPNPTYKQVSAGITDYAEAVRIAYDPQAVTYKQLTAFFFASHDPTQLNRQGPDTGRQYRSEIFYNSDREKETAIAQKQYLDKSGKYDTEIVTLITPFTTFYEAEPYHQDYYENHPRQPYVFSVSRPKVEKFMKQYKTALKPEYINK